MKENGKLGYMDKSGKMVIEPKFEAGSIFVNGIAPVKVGENVGYIDKKGEYVIKPEFQWDGRIIDQYTSYNTTFAKAAETAEKK